MWFMIVAACAVTANWKFGWLPVGWLVGFDANGVATRTTGESTANSPYRDSGFDRDLQSETIEIDPIVFNAQTEPPIDDDQGQARRHPSRVLESRHWDDPPTPTVPLRLPPFVPDGKTTNDSAAGDDSNQSAGQITLLSNEVENDNESENPSDRTAADRRRLPKSNAPAIDLKAIDRMIDAGGHIAAHRELSKIYWNRPELRPAIRKRIEATAESIYFSPQPHYRQPYVVRPGDQLRRIAARYHVPWAYLAKLNQVQPRKIRPGQKLKVINGPLAAVVDLADFQMTIHARGHFVRRYSVGIGKGNSSPIGKFKVVEKVVNPQFTDPEGRVIDADDPKNPLGERWIGIGDGFGIHGTIDPDSVGRAQSRGCIRLRSADVEEVFDLLGIGSEIVIRR